MNNPDITVRDHGSLCVLFGVTPEGLDWLESHLDPEAMRWGNGGFVVEPRYLGPITDGAAEAGLELRY